MKITLEHITPNAEELVSKYSAVCYDSDTTDKLKNEKRIKHLIKVKHLSTLRHAIATFRVEGISRACSHQFVRSKHLDFLQRSQRYVAECEAEIVRPPLHGEQDIIFNDALDAIFIAYNDLIHLGVKKEDARMVLPNACTTELIVTGNLQAWKDFIALRTDKAAQWEIREVALEIERLLQTECPNVFGGE